MTISQYSSKAIGIHKRFLGFSSGLILLIFHACRIDARPLAYLMSCFFTPFDYYSVRHFLTEIHLFKHSFHEDALTSLNAFAFILLSVVKTKMKKARVFLQKIITNIF